MAGMKIAIVGAGIQGSLIAFYATNAGFDVTLFDENNPNEPSTCSYAAAGLLTPTAELEKSTADIFQCGIDGLNIHWPAILAALNKPIFFQKIGSLLVSHPNDKAELSRFMSNLDSKSSIKHYQALSQEEIIALEPALDKFSTGFYFRDEGQIDNQTLLRELYLYLLEKKVVYHANTFIETIESIRHDFDYAIDCRGLGGKEFLPDLRGLRGELIWLHAPEVTITRPVRLAHPRYNLYVAPRPDHVYLIGATEIESEDTSSISVRSALELLSAAYYIHPGFAEARILKTVTHSRPTLPDHLPCIKYNDKIIAVNGLYRHGFLIAPSLAAEVMHFLETGKKKTDSLWETI